MTAPTCCHCEYLVPLEDVGLASRTLSILSNGLSSPLEGPSKLEEFGLLLESLGHSFKEKATSMRVNHFRHLNSKRSAANLPPELLSEIFLLACARHDAVARDRHMHGDISRRARHNITSTCHAWRETAVTTTSLWNCISVVIGKDAPCNYPYKVSHGDYALNPSTIYSLQLEMKRAGNRPLRLLIQIEGDLSDDGDLELAALRAALSRSRFLCITDCGSASVFSALMTEHPIPFPHLRALLISSARSDMWINLSLAPLIETARAHGGPALRHVVPLNVLRLSPNRTDPHLLQRCERVQWLEMRITKRWIQKLKDHKFPEVKLPHLELLSIPWPKGTVNTLEDHILLSSIIAPGLRYLQMNRAHVPSIQGQYPSLYSLDLQPMPEDTSPSISELRDLFAHFPDIGELLMPSRKLKDLGDIFIAKDDHGEFKWLPKLRDLWLDTADDETAKKLIAVRNEGMEEQRGMPLRLNLHRCSAELQKTYNWSVKVRPYVDPFKIVNDSIPISRFGAARSRKSSKSTQTDP